MFRKDACPGIDRFTRPVPEFVQCSQCGGEVEIWSDETTGICTHCDTECRRLAEVPSCLEWCDSADQCKAIINDT